MSRLAVAALLVGASLNAASDSNDCTGLKDVKLPHARIVSAKWVDADKGPVKRAHCEVSAVSQPTSDSEIHFTLWMPAHADWNGKYLQLGSGGWGGTINSRELMGPLARGFAVAATDDGHHSGDFIESLTPSWATGHPEKVIDFGYRALHETATLSKAIVQGYYSKVASHAYFKGCSDGGREALMEAERYPEDFDGIIAGAPANHWTHHFSGFVWNELALNATPESRITADQVPAIERAALAACDALDGVKDGLIEDPRKCHFDPSVLLCAGGGVGGADCLTQPQIDALKKIYAGPKNPRTGEQIYPGYEPGTEAEKGTWVGWILPLPQTPAGSAQTFFGNGFFSRVVFEDALWDWHSMDFDRDVRAADEKAGWILNSWDPDLRTFRDHGGKLIQYHGWGDAAIAPRDSINFYEAVRAFLSRHPDPRSSNPTDILGFYRLFMVPGMGHCGGGPGPTSFGNDGGGPKAGVPVDAEHDVLLALDRWVTEGVAPDKLIGTGKIGGDVKDGVGGIRITRPLCPFPKVARYKGHGHTNAAENFECVQDGGGD